MAMTVAGAKEFLHKHDVRFVLAQFVDLHGVAKTKAVPVEHFEDVVLQDDEGRDVRLGDLWRDRPVALIFLRHYG